MIGACNLLAYESMPALYFNKQIMNEMQLELPYQSVLDGTCTLAKLKEYCRKVSGDIDGDGKMTLEDKYGLGLNSYGSLTFTYGTGVRFVEKRFR